MPDPLAEAGAHPAPFLIALATSVTGAIIGAFRISGRISAVEDKTAEDKTAMLKRVEVAEASIGKLFDEKAALRAEIASLRAEVAELEAAAERGSRGHATVRRTLAELKRALTKEGAK